MPRLRPCITQAGRCSPGVRAPAVGKQFLQLLNVEKVVQRLYQRRLQRQLRVLPSLHLSTGAHRKEVVCGAGVESSPNSFIGVTPFMGDPLKLSSR